MANVYNVEDNVQTPLLGRDLDSKTPLRNHHSAWIRMPTRLIIKIEVTVSSLGVAIWQIAIEDTVTPLGVALWQVAKAGPQFIWRGMQFIWRQKQLLPLLTVIIAVIVVGFLLITQASRGSLNVLLLMLFGWGMILFAIVARLPRQPS
ncbi:hypothetical protein FB567DRAFT_593570 [Paraphoma chrysanthemicola]|uniref:Uncharacterized protein n=1 Tax=Paraphoma chrysanthemicola TaxID=798071 RepID=A0A8K0R1D9_9PLEO|nr:hypothetical protein FB567DRAFT_593570 [Paraphoma chrysanthemicola]